tara:strand:- start:38 stop:331 length:294 start_codon:yes stop_codon:yes gene_type:complete
MATIAFQKAIFQQFPTKRNEQLYLYKKFGSILFKDEWNKLSFIDASHIDEKDMPKIFIGIMHIMEVFTYEEKSNAVNYIFQEAVKRLTSNNTDIDEY